MRTILMMTVLALGAVVCTSPKQKPDMVPANPPTMPEEKASPMVPPATTPPELPPPVTP